MHIAGDRWSDKGKWSHLGGKRPHVATQGRLAAGAWQVVRPCRCKCLRRTQLNSMFSPNETHGEITFPHSAV